jgi:hypothetical protein
VDGDQGVVIGRLDFSDAVRVGDGPRDAPAMAQQLTRVETGARYRIPLPEASLRQDFALVLPGGTYEFERGSADSGTQDDHSLRTAAWQGPVGSFEVVPGEVRCIGTLKAHRRGGFGSLLLAVITLGGASYTFSVEDDCSERIEAFRASAPQLDSGPPEVTTSLMGLLGEDGTVTATSPAGSYLDSCRHVRMDGATLRATCENSAGGEAETALDDAASCEGDIANADGQLVCHSPAGETP